MRIPFLAPRSRAAEPARPLERHESKASAAGPLIAFQSAGRPAWTPRNYAALAKEGYFEWEEFRQSLIASIAGWERDHALDDPSWDYYQRWLEALQSMIERAGLLDVESLRSSSSALLRACQAHGE